MYNLFKEASAMALIHPIPLHDTSLFKFENVNIDKNCRFIKSYHENIDNFLPTHTHNFYEINIVCNGVGIHVLEKREILTQRGDIFIIPPHMKHGYSCNEKLVVYHILLSNLFIDTYLSLLENIHGYNMAFYIEPLLRENIEKLYYLRSKDIPFEQLKQYISLIEDAQGNDNESATIAHVLSLIAKLSNTIYSLRPINTETLSNKDMLTVLESMEYIENHFDSKIDIKKIAQKSGCSYSTYLRYFKTISGTTPSNYQIKCKIKNATNLLLNTNDSILSIALACGFYDSSHFIREFINEKNISPSDFRKKNKQRNTSKS